MFKVHLVNMPFADLALPSIALTQIKSVLESEFPGQVSVELVYLNHDFAKFLGVDLYYYISNSMHSLNAGLGEWFFRQAIFDELPDNTEKYFRRYLWAKSGEIQRIKDLILRKRSGLNAYMEELITRYGLDQGDLVGFTSMFMQNTASFSMAKRIKRRNPRIVTVMGGANCEYPMGRVIAEKIKDIDFTFSGPGLKSFPEFVRCCMDGDMDKRQSIRGVFSKENSALKSGAEVIGEELSIDAPLELDYAPFLARFREQLGNIGVKPVLPIETSRGCWWGQKAHCTFCGLNGATMTYRAMKPELAIRQFKSLFRYSGEVAVVTAVDNILPKSFVTDVLPFLDTPADMELFYEVKADLSEQDLAVLANARVKRIQPGIESLATSTLKLMKKGTTAFQNIGLLKMCALFGLKPVWNLLIGFPGEGAEVYKRYLEVLPLLTHLEPPSGAYPVRFDRFSPYFNQAQTWDLDLHPLEFYSMIYPFNAADLKDFSYYFGDKNLSAGYFTVMTEWIHKVRAVITQWQTRWRGLDNGLQPRLYFKNNSNVVYDSRSGSLVEHHISETGWAILEFLSRPVRLEEVKNVFLTERGIDISSEMVLLQQKGLIFQEGERLLSLVLKGEPGSYQAKYQAESASVAQPVGEGVAV